MTRTIETTRLERQPTAGYRLVRRLALLAAAAATFVPVALVGAGAVDAGYGNAPFQVYCNPGFVGTSTSPTAIGYTERISVYAFLERYENGQWNAIAFQGPWAATWSMNAILPIAGGAYWTNPDGSLIYSRLGPRPAWNVTRGYWFRVSTWWVDPSNNVSNGVSGHCWA